MKKMLYSIFCSILICVTMLDAQSKGEHAKINWPKIIPLKDGGKITIYQPQPESLLGPNLKSSATVSVRNNSKSKPVFGVLWSECYLKTDRNSRMATMQSIKITDVKFPDVQDTAKINALKKIIEADVIKWQIEISLDTLSAKLLESQ